MKTTLIYNLEKQRKTKEIKHNFKVKSLEERNEKLRFNFFKGDKKEILLQGVKIIIADVHIGKPMNFEVKHTFPFLKVQFEMEGYSSYIPKDKGSIPVLIEEGQYNFFYLPKVDGTLHYKKSRRVFEIIFLEEYVKNVFNDFYKIGANFAKSIKDKTPFVLFSKSKPISYKLQLILNDIINCSFDKEIKEVYLSSKIKELLSILVADLNQTSKTKIDPIDQQKIENAEQIIMENLQDSPTIFELSKMIGVNQQKLKVLFKKIYKTSIFKYITDQRMILAKKLLTNSSLTISDISSEVGYKNPQHFTVAFKRKYNILPRDFRKEN